MEKARGRGMYREAEREASIQKGREEKEDTRRKQR
jgi:hypothetical protein